MTLLARSQPHASGVDPFRSLAGPCTCECSCTDQSASHPNRCVTPPPPCVQTTPAASAPPPVYKQPRPQAPYQYNFSGPHNSVSNKFSHWLIPQQSSQSQRTFFVMMIKKRSREITLQTSAIDVCKCGKTICLLD